MLPLPCVLVMRPLAVIDLEEQVAPNLPLILGVESEIRQALMNLILNAVDAMPEGGNPSAAGLVDQPAAVPSPAPSARILVVDDDKRVSKSLRRVLEADGHRVTVADGGQAGIEISRLTAEAES